MGLKIVRNDITKMNTQAIVNTANPKVCVGPGCDRAIYTAAGEEELFNYRREHIGEAREGEVFLTPGFNLQAEYIIHAVSPRFVDGKSGEEDKLRLCYQKSLKLAKEQGITSLSFPLIASGSFAYPKEEAMRIAVDEIQAFLLHNQMEVFLVVFDSVATGLGRNISPDLEAYIDRNYVEQAEKAEYNEAVYNRDFYRIREGSGYSSAKLNAPMASRQNMMSAKPSASRQKEEPGKSLLGSVFKKKASKTLQDEELFDFEPHESKLEERMRHMSDTYSQYLMYLIQERNMENAEVWKRAIVDKKIFSKIKNNINYHPNKLTALCLCIGAKLNLDESRDLLARAGYALSPCDKTDIIFSYFIENEIYDMIELDIQLEEHGLACIIS